MHVTGADRAIDVCRVESAADLDAFIDLPYRLYRGDGLWVPPLKFERRRHFSAKNPYFEHARVALWLARRNGRPVGRLSTQICTLYQERYGAGTGHFGFLEAEDDPQVFDALFAAGHGWLADNGITRVEGPFSFSINDESGLLVDGFDTPPSVMMNHAKPYYADHVMRLGYAKARDLFAYEYGHTTELPRTIAAMIERNKKAGDFVIRPWDMANFDRDLAIAIDIFNDAWQDNWGFVPMTYNEVKSLGDDLKLLVRGNYAAIGLYKGEPAAMAITLPNINEAIADLDGKLLPFGWVKLLWRLKALPPHSVRMPLMGVRKKYQSGLVGSSLAIGVILQVRDYHLSRGTRSSELSWILENNEPVKRLIELLGGRHYKTYRMYETSIAADGRA